MSTAFDEQRFDSFLPQNFEQVGQTQSGGDSFQSTNFGPALYHVANRLYRVTAGKYGRTRSPRENISTFDRDRAGSTDDGPQSAFYEPAIQPPHLRIAIPQGSCTYKAAIGPLPEFFEQSPVEMAAKRSRAYSSTEGHGCDHANLHKKESFYAPPVSSAGQVVYKDGRLAAILCP